MNIEEVQEMKKQLEETIKSEIRAFNEKTGLQVSYLDLSAYRVLDAYGAYTKREYMICIDVEV